MATPVCYTGPLPLPYKVSLNPWSAYVSTTPTQINNTLLSMQSQLNLLLGYNTFYISELEEITTLIGNVSSALDILKGYFDDTTGNMPSSYYSELLGSIYNYVEQTLTALANVTS